MVKTSWITLTKHRAAGPPVTNSDRGATGCNSQVSPIIFSVLPGVKARASGNPAAISRRASPDTLAGAGILMASRTPTTIDPASEKLLFGHPVGLATLFFTEMWERFSYYGMRAILILFMTSSIAKGGLGYADSKAGAVYGLYTAMVYLMCLGGGW